MGLLRLDALAELDGIDPDDWPAEWTIRGWTAEALAAAREERRATPAPEPEPDLGAVANRIAQLGRADR